MKLIWVLVIVLVGITNASNWYFDHWCGHGLEYLDDGKCVKKFPSIYNRDWTCPVPLLSSPPEGYQPDGPLSSMKVDTSTLAQIMTDTDVNICVIMTKRVVDSTAPQGVRLYNKYMCAGDYSANVPFETWSSSKIFAMANAAGHLRSNETQCGSGNANNQLYGLDGTVHGKHGVTPFGDLASVICSYDTTAGYSSNSLSSYFHDIGWRDRIDDLVVNWLGAKDQSLGGNYGEATPSDLGFVVTTPEDPSNANATCAVDKDPWPKVYSNSISSLSAAELTRRIALHREIDEKLRFPGSTWTDMQTILYGAESSALFPGLQWGGMTTDTGIFVQSASSMNSLLSDTKTNHDMWRIFSKLGCGYSSSRYRGEMVTNAHACVPTYNDEGVAIGGYEFTLNARGSVLYDSSLTKAQAKVVDAVQKVVNYILSQ